jgi:hypothetical protein
MQYKDFMNKTSDVEGTAPGGFRGVRGLAAHGLSLAVLFALAAFPPLYHDIARDALANADMDIVSVYQALLIIAGQPLLPNPHTGYVYFLSLAGWFHLFDWLNLVALIDIDALKASPDFDGLFAQLIVAGRWFSIFLACLLVTLVYTAVWMVHPNRIHALLLGILFTIGGGGVTAQSVMMRTELPSMVLLFAAAVALIAATRARAIWALGFLAVAGFLVHASMMVKVQSVIVVVFLPVLALVFGWENRMRSLEIPPRRVWAGVLAAALAVSVPVAAIYYQNLIPESPGLYQLLIAAFVLASTLAYGHFNLGAARHGVIGFAAVAVGFSLAYGLIAVNGQWWTAYSIVNFIELMSVYLPQATEASAQQLEGLAAAKTLSNVADKLAGGLKLVEIDRFFTERLRNFDYPFAFLYGAVPASVVFLAAKRKFDAALTAGFLCLMTGMIVVIFWAGRGFFNFYYSIYVEAWVILAAAIAVRELAPMTVSWPRHWLRTGQVGVLVVIVFVVAVNVRFRLLDPAAANPVVAKSACFIRGITPLFYTKFDGYCGTG